MEDFMDQHLNIIFIVSIDNGKDQQKNTLYTKDNVFEVDRDVQLVWRTPLLA